MVLQETFRADAPITQISKSWFEGVARYINRFRVGEGLRLETQADGSKILRIGDDQYQFREIVSAEPQFTNGVLTGIAFRRIRALCSMPEETITVDVEECGTGA